jgi:HCOMODA/2-hydroxy-3-carboxy-muconic semialdehyde decarboxylase
VSRREFKPLTIPDSDAPNGETERLREDLVAAAHGFAKLGYMHAFGHVSARRKASILITPTRPPFAAQGPSDIIEVGFDGAVLSGDRQARPLEVFLHLGIYRARVDVHAICRAHPPAASLWWGDALLPVQHGFGGIVGELAGHDFVDLIHNAELGGAAAQSLGGAGGLFLRGNGALTVGKDVGEAAARMWSLEERCAFALRQGGKPTPFSDENLRDRQRWYAAEAERIWAWLKQL